MWLFQMQLAWIDRRLERWPMEISDIKLEQAGQLNGIARRQVGKLNSHVDSATLARQQRELDAKLQTQNERGQQRVNQTIGLNSTLPVTVSSVRIVDTSHTRPGFLEQAVKPLLTLNQNGPYPFSEALKEIVATSNRLSQFDIFRQPISTYIDKSDPADPLSTPTDLSVIFSAKEKSRYTIRTGTEAGHLEGSAYADVALRNIFGGAESLVAHASIGTRTRSAYSAVLGSPLFTNPALRWELAALRSSTAKPWASHDDNVRGASTSLKWMSKGGHQYEFSYSGFWRQITGLASSASPTVRGDAGDSFKSSLAYKWIYDRRDIPFLPTRGYMFRTESEIAGYGPLGGDVAFSKTEYEAQGTFSIPFLSAQGRKNITFNAGLRCGLLYPLALSGSSTPAPSRINDRFHLGGPTDVRGFRLCGIGPRDGADAVGGDVYAAGGASVLIPLPRIDPETPLRLQFFLNGGRLLGLNHEQFAQAKKANEESRPVSQAIGELVSELPSCAAGVGLVYAHPSARFELNFSLPLVVRRGEEGRKGISFGIGLSFL